MSFAESKQTLTVTIVYFILQNEMFSLAEIIKLKSFVWNIFNH